MEIYLIRHTKVNVDLSVCYGQTDVGLDPDYMEAFKVIKTKIPPKEDLVFYSSPLTRCKMLANYLSDGNFTTDDRLKEINLGDWEMESWDFIQENLFSSWEGDFTKNKSPNGESFIDLYNRCVDFFNEIIQTKHNKIAIVGHNGTVRAMVANILQMPHHKDFALKLDYGGISKIEIVDKHQHLMYFNR